MVIELDGSVHNSKDQKEADGERTYELAEKGISIIRFRNEEVTNNIKSVIERIIEVAEKIEKD